ncbi:metal ABC transporter permease [Corynebacterium phoceense]|uniref:metal ABC transporter permease n=1 Tax=Corynebacterium phoceense TaxID=1686286 RepID=UPI00211C4226|nr:metal ABC transporter permease [Corynebacterium phoceense]MCQ9345083.1 metal ABC transporter permease [Corynebacterium phoceense]
MILTELFTNYTYQQALAGTVTIGACAGALGPLVYLRRQSLLADAVSHSSLPGLLVAFVTATALGMNGRNVAVLVCGAVATGLLAVATIHALPKVTPLKQDAVMAAVLTTFFSVGMLILQYVSRTPLPGKAGIQDFLLGNASTLTRADVAASLVIGVGILVMLAAVHNHHSVMIFDPAFARVTGTRTRIINALAFVAITVITVLGVKVVGVVLMVAVVVSPAAAARQWIHRLPAFIGLASLLGAACAALGTALSIHFAIPTGPTIVLVQAAVVAMSLAVSPRRRAVIA